MENFSDIGSQVGLPASDFVPAVLNVMRLVLGLAPLVAVVMLIFGGFMWMTSGGDEERLEQAKKTVSGALIGLVIIFLSWAIVNFVIRTTLNVSVEDVNISN